MKAKSLFLFAILAACGASEKGTGTSGRSAPEVKPQGAVAEYRGPNRMRVQMLRVEGSGVDALVRVYGLKSELEDKVLPCTTKETDRGGTAYVTQLHGEDFWVLREDADGSVWVVVPEDYRKSHQIALDTDNKPDALAKMLSDFKAGYESGDLPRLAAWNRGEREKQHESNLKDEFADASKQCQKSFNVKIDWDSVTDDMLKDKSISGFCEPISDALENMCKRFSSARDELKSVSEVRCTFQGEPGVRKEGDALVWVPGDSNIDAQAWRALALAMERSPTMFKSGQIFLVVDVGDPDKPMFYGDGSVFTKQRRTNMSSGPEHHYLFNGAGDASFGLKDGEWKLECRERTAVFTEVQAAERKKVLSGATFKEYAFDREPFALARDDRGTYYYVDQRLRELGGKAFQVHIGKVGAVATTDLKDIVDDSQGMIFSTKSGSLRLILSSQPPQAAWVVGEKKPTNLTALDVYGNPSLIYDKLGVYDKVDLGTVCDRL